MLFRPVTRATSCLQGPETVWSRCFCRVGVGVGPLLWYWRFDRFFGIGGLTTSLVLAFDHVFGIGDLTTSLVLAFDHVFGIGDLTATFPCLTLPPYPGLVGRSNRPPEESLCYAATFRCTAEPHLPAAA